ncbi:MAG TPA: hypothetical protein VNX68_01565 [Nitrosopumilaceae archaeon]|jgi:hypothetical protein|nr:hypothetical protein [Nitrosopumilaceae archaeon]
MLIETIEIKNRTIYLVIESELKYDEKIGYLVTIPNSYMAWWKVTEPTTLIFGESFKAGHNIKLFKTISEIKEYATEYIGDRMK